MDRLKNPPPDPEVEKIKRGERKEEERRQFEEKRHSQRMVDTAETERLWVENKDLVLKFFEISYRKVSIRDDYGDESWSVLHKQIVECLQKIGEREGVKVGIIKDWFKDDKSWRLEYSSGKEKQFRELARRLDSSFRIYHEKQKNNLVPMSEIEGYSGQEFEAYIAKLLPLIGFHEICGTPVTGDQGADLLARKDDRLFVFQVKRQKSPVGNKAVQEVVAALQFYGGDEGWVITNSTFTPAASALAEKSGVRLVDGVYLGTLIQQVLVGSPNV
ncbi:restriction endonuclease [candidate division KSB1 bacterium]|nr:restriction endonuclease [candidate division KSB1 bacterium]